MKSSAGFLSIALLLLAAPLAAANPDYRFLSVRTIAGPCCGDWGSDIEIDADGAVLIAGRRGGLDLDRDGSVDVRAHGTPDPLALAFSLESGEFLWVDDPGGPGEDFASSIASDREGGAFVAGQFSEQMQIASGTVTARGGQDGFLARYDRTGRVLWIRPIGGEANDRMAGVASDAAGNAYVIGTISGAVDVDLDGTIDVASEGRSALVLASFDPDGDLRWARATAGSAITMGWSVVIGHAGEVYVAGHYMSGTLDIDGDGTQDAPEAAMEPAGDPPYPDMNGFLARLDADGDWIWWRTISGKRIQSGAVLAIAGDGDLLAVSAYTDPPDLDADGVPDMEFRSMAGRVWEHDINANALLLKLSPDGDRRWVRRYAALPNNVSADASRIVVTGTYTGDLDFDDDGVIDRPADPDEYNEGVIAILDNDGNQRHVFSIVGGDADAPYAAVFTPDGERLLVTGYTRVGADFSGDGEIESDTACHQLGDVFIATYLVKD